MSKPQPNSRIAAARAFVESLDQLQTILAQETPASEPQPQKLDMKVWEEAAADLDEFFGDVQPLPSVEEEDEEMGR